MADSPKSPDFFTYDLVKLREIIARSDYTDLRIFCADLNEDYNAVVGEGKTVREAVLALVKYFENRGRIGELVERVKREFPSAEWVAVMQPMSRDAARDRIAQSDLIPDKVSVSRRAVLAGIGSVGMLGAGMWLTSRVLPPPVPRPTSISTTRVATTTEETQSTSIITLAPTAIEPKSSTTLPKTLTLSSPIFMEFVLVSAGPFLMGSDTHKSREASEDESPPSILALPDYYIGKYEVTNAQWQVFTRANPPIFDFPSGKEQHPVVSVTWFGAILFCNWLSQESERKVMLPSEAEWEKAARGKDGRVYPWGNDLISKEQANYGNNVGGTTPVGYYIPASERERFNGTADMAGNVFEWTRSLWGKNAKNPEYRYPYSNNLDARENLNAPDYIRRVIRGGSWDFSLNHARAAARNSFTPASRSESIGFRVICVPDPVR